MYVDLCRIDYEIINITKQLLWLKMIYSVILLVCIIRPLRLVTFDQSVISFQSTALLSWNQLCFLIEKPGRNWKNRGSVCVGGDKESENEKKRKQKIKMRRGKKAERKTGESKINRKSKKQIQAKDGYRQSEKGGGLLVGNQETMNKRTKCKSRRKEKNSLY